MPTNGMNRYELLASDDHGQSSPESDREITSRKRAPVVTSADMNGNPQKQEKRGVETAGPKTLVIKNMNLQPRARLDSTISTGSGASTLQRGSSVYSTTKSYHTADTHNTAYYTLSTHFSAYPSNENDEPFKKPEYLCGICNLKFDGEREYGAHCKQFPDHDNHCALCRRVFKDKAALEMHNKASSGHDFTCNLCLSAFKDENGLRNHIESGHQFRCLTCVKGFTGHEQMVRHLNTADVHISCRTCHRRFRNQTERDEHWAKTTKHKHCLQPGCDADFPNDGDLRRHLAAQHFMCRACGKVFPSRNKLNSHFCHSAQEHQHPDRVAEYLENLPPQGLQAPEPPQNVQTPELQAINCWLCAAPMDSPAALIKHIERGKCPKLPEPSHLVKCLCAWYHSVLYMDVDIHRQIRTGRVNMKTAMEWVNEGEVPFYICRAEGCGRTFCRLSSLVHHVENHDCVWSLGHLRLDELREVLIRCLREDDLL